MPLKVSTHPLVLDALARLRDRDTEPAEFRVLARRAVTFLLHDATADLATVTRTVTTPLADTQAAMVDAEVVVVPVLRAGLGMLPPILELLPKVSVGYVGLERDEETAQARIYYQKLPDLTGRVPLLVDPMLATGGSACQAIELIKRAGGAGIRMICVVAAPPGVELVTRNHPDVDIYSAALDERLDHRAYIVPGLGDFGDRLFGTP